MNNILKTLGLPPLGQRWTKQELALAALAAVVAIPFLVLAALGVGLWRFITAARPTKTYTIRTDRADIDDYPQSGPYRREDLIGNRCRFCQSQIHLNAQICPYCRQPSP